MTKGKLLKILGNHIVRMRRTGDLNYLEIVEWFYRRVYDIDSLEVKEEDIVDWEREIVNIED